MHSMSSVLVLITFILFFNVLTMFTLPVSAAPIAGPDSYSGASSPAKGGDVDDYCDSFINVLSGNAGSSVSKSGNALSGGSGNSYTGASGEADGGNVRGSQGPCPLSLLSVLSGNAGDAASESGNAKSGVPIETTDRKGGAKTEEKECETCSLL